MKKFTILLLLISSYLVLSANPNDCSPKQPTLEQFQLSVTGSEGVHYALVDLASGDTLIYNTIPELDFVMEELEPLSDGCYAMIVGGYYSLYETSWELLDMNGILLASDDFGAGIYPFIIGGNTDDCQNEPPCDLSLLCQADCTIEPDECGTACNTYVFNMIDPTGTGWSFNSYTLTNQYSGEIFTGNFTSADIGDNQFWASDFLCNIPDGFYTYTFGGGMSDDIFQFSFFWHIIDLNGNEISPLTPDGSGPVYSTTNPASFQIGNWEWDNEYSFYMEDSAGDGWNGATYSLSNSNGDLISSGSLDNATLGNGLNYGANTFADLPDGCYEVSITGGNQDAEIAWRVVNPNGIILLTEETETSYFAIGDVSCANIIEGCTDASACNYDSTANTDDNSCVYPDCLGNCNGQETGSNIVGIDCDDGNPNTFFDQLDSNCNCVGIPNFSYCQEGGLTTPSGLFLESFSLSGVNCSEISYSWYPSYGSVYQLQTVQLQRNYPYTASASYQEPCSFFDYPCPYNNSIVAWIDYDQSGTFEETETILMHTGSPDLGSWAESFFVPSNVMLGYTKMRVMVFEGFAGAPIPDPCDSNNSAVDFNVYFSEYSVPAANECFAGCSDPCDSNYSPFASTVNTSFCSGINICGCTDPTACNYDENSWADDGSCEYVETDCDCLNAGSLIGIPCDDGNIQTFNDTYDSNCNCTGISYCNMSSSGGLYGPFVGVSLAGEFCSSYPNTFLSNSAGGFSSYGSEFIVVSLEQGKTYSINASYDCFGSTCNLTYGVWIDYNQNTIFDEEELLGSGGGISGPGSSSTFTFTVPSDAPLGITGIQSSFSSSGAFPCTGLGNDFLVNIIENSLAEEICQLDCSCTGCWDICNANFDPLANIHDADLCTGIDICGCTNPMACNYDPNAIFDEDCSPVPTNCLNPDPCEALFVTAYDFLNNSPVTFSITNATTGLAIVIGYGSQPICPLPEGCYTIETGTDFGPSVKITNADGVDIWTELNYDYNLIIGNPCNDPLACNYNPDPVCINNTTCFYEEVDCPGFCENNPTLCGCTNPFACNYNPNALLDTEDCIYPSGCSDVSACNYDSNADCPDNTLCVYETSCNTDPCSFDGIYEWNSTSCSCELLTSNLSGCMDQTACNFDPAATCDGNTCIYETSCSDNVCTAPGIMEWNTNICSCIVVEALVLGCMNPVASNYNPNANCEDGSCTNCINIGAPCDDGDVFTFNDAYNSSCECVGDTYCATFEGAYNSNTNASGLVLYYPGIDGEFCSNYPNVSLIGYDINDFYSNVVDASVLYFQQGNSYEINIASNCFSPNCNTTLTMWIDYNQNLIFDEEEQVQLSNSGIDYITIPSDALTGFTMMRVVVSEPNPDPCGYHDDGTDIIVNIIDDTDVDSCLADCTCIGCLDVCDTNFDPFANTHDDSLCSGIQIENCIGCAQPCDSNYDPDAIFNDYNLCLGDNVCGCTDISACNYDPYALTEDYNCEYSLIEGCSDPIACNYNPSPVCFDNTTCIYEVACSSFDPCIFGGTFLWNPESCACELDQPALDGCTDPNACNYNDAANCADGSCLYGEDCTGEGFVLAAKIILEGPYIGGGMMMSGLGSLIPLSQPYNIAPYNHTGTETASIIPTNAVDWVIVEMRSGIPANNTQNTIVVETKAGFLLDNGDIVDVDGISLLTFENLTEGENYHICIRHRNHLDVLSVTPVIANATMAYDFTTAANQAFGLGQLKEIDSDVYGLYAGDYTQEGVIQTTDYDLWFALPASLNVYSVTDGTLDGVVQNTDFDKWFENKAKLGVAEVRFD